MYFEKIGLVSRAQRLSAASREIMENYKGDFPKNKEYLLGIKGIGNYIASAILCFGYGRPYPIVDTNIIRIFDRCFDVKSNKTRPRTDKFIWTFAKETLPKKNFIDYNYALLDFAATICRARNPKCKDCFFFDNCNYEFKTKKLHKK